MIRINYIADLIQPCSRVIDIGSDHAYLAINLLNNKKAQMVCNVEVNQKPLEAGINNLIKYNCLDKTQNILNNGLKDINTKLDDIHFDYLTIAGMGSNNIIEILQHNQLIVDTYILQTNRNEYALRHWLIHHGYSILQEHVVKERDIFYPILVVKKVRNHKLYKKIDLYFGKLSNVKDINLSYAYLIEQRRFLQQQISKNPQIAKNNTKLIKLMNKMVKKYESKGNL